MKNNECVSGKLCKYIYLFIMYIDHIKNIYSVNQINPISLHGILYLQTLTHLLFILKNVESLIFSL